MQVMSTCAAPTGEIGTDAQQWMRWRHHLHSLPETGFKELRTSDYVASGLAMLGLEAHRGIGGTGIVAKRGHLRRARRRVRGELHA
jgi:metal-dependent amidase/aminoacylase/carboxypeptidase family protein